jgi:hypothetical protein
VEHVEGLGPANLAHDDPVGAHEQRVADELAQGDLAHPLGVGGPGLQADHVLTGQA